MTEVFHERLKSPIATAELERRVRELTTAMKKENIDVVLSQNITQYMGSANRWFTDTTAENHYPQSSFVTAEGFVGHIACSGPPLDLYPPPHLIRIGKPWDAAPYFSVFNYTWDWEGQLFARYVRENNLKRIGVPGMEMIQWNYYDYLKKNLPGVEIVDVSSMFDEIRAIKSADEIVFLKKSVAIQDKIMGYMQAYALPGVREYEIRAKAMQIVTDHGGEEMVILMGSAPQGQTYQVLPSFFQNRELQLGDEMYLKLDCSGPGGLFTTVGRTFSIGCEPSDAMHKNLAEALAAQEKLVAMLKPGAQPEVIFDQYNAYLASFGYQQEAGLFAYGQGYDHIERPSIQPGETMALAENMCLAVNTNLVSAPKSIHLADSYLIGPTGAQKMSKLPATVFRT